MEIEYIVLGLSMDKFIERLRNGPVKGRDVYIADNAVVVGDVRIGADASIWFSVVLRGDVNYIEIGIGSNIQDGSVVHVSHNQPALIGEYTSVGHNVNLHGCKVGNNVLVGIGAIILDGSEIGDNSIVAAGTLVPPGKVFPPGVMLMGSPAVITRKLNSMDIDMVQNNAKQYVIAKDIYLKDAGVFRGRLSHGKTDL